MLKHPQNFADDHSIHFLLFDLQSPKDTPDPLHSAHVQMAARFRVEAMVIEAPMPATAVFNQSVSPSSPRLCWHSLLHHLALHFV